MSALLTVCTFVFFLLFPSPHVLSPSTYFLTVISPPRPFLCVYDNVWILSVILFLLVLFEWKFSVTIETYLVTALSFQTFTYDDTHILEDPCLALLHVFVFLNILILPYVQSSTIEEQIITRDHGQEMRREGDETDDKWKALCRHTSLKNINPIHVLSYIESSKLDSTWLDSHKILL